MGAAIHQIQQRLDAITVESGHIAQDLHRVYQGYLATLGESVAKQLVMAAYHLCTQFEPQAFLDLTLTQQQNLQQSLQQLGCQLQQGLQEALPILIQPAVATGLDPDEVVLSVQKLEQEIVETLRETSRQANHLLQEHHILEIKSIDALFETAAQAEDAGRSVTSAPHLLKALVESKGSDEDDNVPVMAIYLQVIDLEFADPEVMGWRHQLRQLTQRLASLNKDFDQQQDEKITAEAEAAWRASWFPYAPAPQPDL